MPVKCIGEAPTQHTSQKIQTSVHQYQSICIKATCPMKDKMMSFKERKVSLSLGKLWAFTSGLQKANATNKTKDYPKG